jgi:hypothetical protein
MVKPHVERQMRRNVRNTKAKLTALEERLGRMMSLRVELEEQLASEYDELLAAGLPIEAER